MSVCLIIGGLLVALGAEPETAADRVTLRDGKVALGQVVEPAPRGKIIVLIRREWAKAHLAEWARTWETAEAGWAPRARKDRRNRLTAWKRERVPLPGQDRVDPIIRWIDAELGRPADAAGPEATKLMAVQIAKTDVRKVDRRPDDVARMLRQGWLAGFADVEATPLDELRQGLEGRGFALNGADPAPVERLLPVMPEPDAKWRLRRAATELENDRGLRFVRYEGLVLPEERDGAAPGGAALNALAGSLKALVDPDGRPPEDPLEARFREVAAKGRIGLALTRLNVLPDLSSVSVEVTVWVRNAAGRWEPADRREATVRPDALGPDAGADLAADPQVKMTFQLFEALGLGQVDPGTRQRSLNVGAATRQALGLARGAITRDLEQLALPLEAPAAREETRPPEGAGADTGSRR